MRTIWRQAGRRGNLAVGLPLVVTALQSPRVQARDPFRLFSRDWLPIGMSQVVAVSCGIGSVHLASRWVTPEDFGAYGLFLSVVPLGSMLTHAGLIKHFSRHWLPSRDKNAYLKTWLLSSVPPALVLAALALVLGWSGFLAVSSLWIGLALCVAGIAGTYGQAFQLAVQSAARYWIDLGLTTAGSTTRSFLPLLLVAATAAGLPALVSGYVLHTFVIAAAAFAAIAWLGRGNRVARRQDGEGRDRQSETGAPASIRDYQLLYLFNGALTLVNLGIVRWCASFAFDAETLGHITMAANLAAVGPSVIAGALWQYFYPRMLETHSTMGLETLRALIDRALGIQLAICALGGGALWILLPYLTGTLISQQYVAAFAYIMPLFAYYVSLCGLTLIQGELLVLDRPRAAVKLAALGTAILAGGLLAVAWLAPERFTWWLWLSPLVALLPVRVALRAFSRT